MKVKIRNVRITFPVLFNPKGIRQEDGSMSTPKYGASFLFPPNGEQHKELSKAIIAVAKEKWPTAWEIHVRNAKATDKLCVHDGNLKTYQGYANNLFLTASTEVQPDVRDSDASRLGSSKAGRIYAGCYVDAVVQLWAQDNKWGKRVNAELLGVQFRRDGDAFRAGAVAADEDFEDLSTEDTGSAPAAEEDSLV